MFIYYVYVFMYICMYVYMYICIYVYMYVCKSLPSNSLSTTSLCFSQTGLDRSITCISTSASRISSRVARNAATKSVGSFEIKPTVSVSNMSWPFEYFKVFSLSFFNFWIATFLVVGSKVANNKSSAKTPSYGF